MADASTFVAHARSDREDCLIDASEPIARLQLRCGGDMPGTIAIAPLLELVRKSRRDGRKLSQTIHVQDGEEHVSAWVEVTPYRDTADGCDILVSNWKSHAVKGDNLADMAGRRAVIDRQIAEFSARLDPLQRVLVWHCTAPDLESLTEQIECGKGRPWTDFVTIAGNGHHQPLHWRLLDGALLSIDGSTRQWRATLLPLGEPEPGSQGFELYFVAGEPLFFPMLPNPDKRPHAPYAVVGRDIAPVLRQPISRIVANAETIRTRLAGPLAEEYGRYAADIATAGKHLLGLVDDLADLEVVEADDFSTAPDRIDLADVARRAAGILSVRAQEKAITVQAPQEIEVLPAVGEFRRVLQVLLNLIGNAIRYSPDGSVIWLRVEREGAIARVSVIDQGPGLTKEHRSKVFEKFERLGRTGDGGSGLGLYISRRLARAMDGELLVESEPGQGARFILELPVDIDG